ncbi:hypothetical protein Cni_G07466 [Canna indica]|uniref:Centromere protein Mis12 n=1 Tax=Canna indica TaxID=4628 RepID=A0AAQ3Q7J9_9LILI|nr:hypothetical protein Cni_G07466 [Canna indica]
MEGSESEAVFDAFNLNPQRFLNEVLNAVDDITDSAFDFCLQQAQQITGGGADRSEELSRGISSLHHLTQSVLDKRMSMWEKYCLRHCFSVPDGFVLPDSKESSISVLQEGLSDQELDFQLDSLREKLTAVGKESEVLQWEINLLEKQSTVSNNYNASITEVQHLFEEHSVPQMFQELLESTTKLHQKMVGLKSKRSEDVRKESLGKMFSLSRENQMLLEKRSSPRLEDIQEIVSILRNT